LTPSALKQLSAGAAQLGIRLTPDALGRLGRYEELLVEGNRRINLVSRADVHRIAGYHFLDSIAAAPLLPPDCRLCDVGSGAGLPGIPLKIVRDDISLVMIESIRKKALFLDLTIRQLELSRSCVWHRRAEEVREEKFDVVTCRLLGTIRDLAPLVEPLLGPGGFAVFYKSATLESEIAESQPVLDRLRLHVREVRELHLPPPSRLARRLAVIARAGK